VAPLSPMFGAPRTREAARSAVREESRHQGGRRAPLPARRIPVPPSLPPTSRSRTSRASRTTGSTSGGDIATCRIRLSRHFTRGTRQIAEESYEQPRRHPGLDSGEFASLDRPLPFVPLFDDLRAASLLAAFKWHLERMGWRVPRAGGLGRSLDACPREDCKGQGYILGRPRARGHS
jgi:hypothetical protein